MPRVGAYPTGPGAHARGRGLTEESARGYAAPGRMGARGVAVVTGAGRGIGRALALELARAGHPVALQARSPGPLEAVRAEIEAAGGRAIVVPGDVAVAASAAALVERAEAELGPLTVAVACAGQARSAPLLRTTPEQVTELFAANALSAFHLMQRAAQAMVTGRRPGRIVVVASTAAVKGARYTSAYAASKHAALGLVRSAALELAPHRITVNALCPGWVRTPMLDDTVANIAAKTGCTEAEALARIEAMIPVGAALEVEHVAAMLRWVVSDEAAHLTGQALVLDGGETL
jgi:meso-butanediol dehydrogenase/(S,S)-butanediol dehydrogenase/diacetyl reductase